MDQTAPIVRDITFDMDECDTHIEKLNNIINRSCLEDQGYSCKPIIVKEGRLNIEGLLVFYYPGMEITQESINVLTPWALSELWKENSSPILRREGEDGSILEMFFVPLRGNGNNLAQYYKDHATERVVVNSEEFV